jgi:PAS domain S-box-containing protein
MATVLVVDDVAANRDVVGTLLGYGGHRVLAACEGHEALMTARREHPDVIVTDVLMPGMDGYELARALRADPATAQVALIFHTVNYDEHELASLIRTCGVSRVVSKAGDPQLLLDAVEAALAEPPPSPPDPPAAGPDLDLDHVRTVNAKLIDKIQQLSTSEARFRVIARSSPVGIFLVTRDGDASYVNERLRSIMGLSESALLGDGWLRCFGPDLRDQLLAAARDPAGHDAERRYRVRFRRPDGQARWLNSHLRVILDEEGRTAGAVGMVDDITAVVEAEERSRAEARRQDLDAKLRVSQRLDSLRRLAGGVAHDYNNLLAAILSFGGFAKETITDQLAHGRMADDAAHQALADLDRVLEAARRATGLSRQLQLFGSRAVVTAATVEVNDVIRAEAEMLAGLIGDEIDVDLRLDPRVGAARAGADQVLHVLQVLISNARDAMPGGGELLIETAGVRIDDAAGSDDALAAGDYVRLTVRDTGCGMPGEVLAQAIEPFFTTKARGNGPGLGLATAYGIAMQVGGDLRIESVPGAGTSVHLILPAAGAEAGPLRPHGPSPRGEDGTYTVLVVDDEAALRELAARILGKAGYRVLVAADGPEALALAEQHAGTIAGLLTDVVMPRMLGSELAQRLTARLPGLAVVYMSGYADPALDQPGGLGPGATMLSKPFSRADLLAAVGAALRANGRT